MTPERLLAPFADKGKQVSSSCLGVDTGTENQNREHRLEPMGTGFVTSVRDMCSTACGCQKGTGRSPATTVQPRRWSALSGAFRFPTGNGGIGQEEKGHGQRRRGRWRWSQRLSQKGVGLGVGDRKSPPPWWGSRSS